MLTVHPSPDFFHALIHWGAWMGAMGWMFVSGFGLMAGEASPTVATPAPERPPNILLIVVDTLRADHVSSYGYEKPTAPFLDRLAHEGARFERHFSGAPWTTPSLATLFTGTPAARHGLDDVRKKLPDDLPTLAEKLRAAGYYTLGVLCNPCAAGRMGYARGFDRYDDFSIPLDLEMNLFGAAGTPRHVGQVVTGPKVTKIALRHLAARPKDKPWFLFVLYYDPHIDYVPDEPYRALFGSAGWIHRPLPPHAEWQPGTPALAEAVARYDGEIRGTDDAVKTLWEGLRAANHFTDDDLLVWTADHGEEFRDHGELMHGGTYFDEIIRVPFAMRWPGKIPAGRTVSALTAHEDVGAALLSAAGALPSPAPPAIASPDAKPSPAWPTPAIDLLALAQGEADAGRSGIGLSGNTGGGRVGWRTGDWLVVRDDKTATTRAWRLADDPGQRHPLDPAAHPESRELSEALSAWKTAMAAKRQAAGDVPEAAPPTAREKEILKSLGYLN